LKSEYAIVFPFSIEIIDPLFLFSIGPLYGANSSNPLERIHSPFVIVVNSDLKPRSPLVGTLNSRFTIPFSSIIFVISHFLFPNSAITDHSAQAGTDIVTFSIGSTFCPFSSCIITTGAHTCSSKPSLLIVSINTDR
jgi:hypothetical protein